MRLRHMWRAVAAALAITTLMATLVATPTSADEPEQDTPAPDTPDTTTAAPPTTAVSTSEAAATEPPTSTATTVDDPSADDPSADDPVAGDTIDETTPTTTTSGSTTSTSLPHGAGGGSPASTTPPNTSESSTSESSPSESGTSGSSPIPPDSTAHEPASTHETEHSVEITSIQVSVADTGHNTSTAGGTPGGGQTPAPSGGSQLTTGAASAIGSRDSTQLVQQAITELTNDASAEIVQISITFNIGAAVANSGTNAMSNGTGTASASITSGKATAIGNDSQTFVTQGAAASAGTAAADSAQQSTMVVHVGVARSNTGANTIIATVTSTGTGSIGTGDASAIGNQSTTEIEQLAQAVGTNSGELTIRQRATVINLGLALADSGSNAIGGVLAAAIDTGDSADFERLLALILPELLRTALRAPEAAAPDSAASGSTATGDALAIGNRSTTAVRQVAVGAADGGTVEIGQDVVVVNAGVASATTGRNAIGPPQGATLDPESQVVVTQLAVFLSNLLDRIDAWSGGEEVELESDSVSASLGGLTIGLDSSLAANVLSGGAVSGATIRQLTAVINLAFALANTGHNTQSSTASGVATSGRSDSTLALASVGAVDAVPQASSAGSTTLIVTGNASATNSMLVVVCQLSNADITCLGPEPEQREPPTTTQPPAVEQPVNPTPATPDQPAEVPSQPITGDDPQPEQTTDPQPQPDVGRQGLLAITGGEPATVLRIAAVLVLAGLVLSAASRRPTPRSPATA